jgi:zinc/manganese transport system permease protein
MSDIIQFFLYPFLACLVLTGIHTYLGQHVIQRQVIFVDLSLAQIAALGASIALVMGHELNTPLSYWLSLAFTIVGAAVFAFSRFRKGLIPQEAVIGATYAVSAALLILVLSLADEGDEHIREALIGKLLLVSEKEVFIMFLTYVAIGIFHFVFRRNFFLISRSHEEAEKNLNVRFWDFLFYVSFGIVVTSSVKIAGVLLVFSFLVIPAACSFLFGTGTKIRLMIGWAIGLAASTVGMVLSYFLDLPTAPTIICVLGVILYVSIFLKNRLRVSGCN